MLPFRGSTRISPVKLSDRKKNSQKGNSIKQNEDLVADLVPRPGLLIMSLEVSTKLIS